MVDVDVRWAGEPDVVLHLTKISRARLGLKNLQISAMVRLVFSPIIEDPPFLQRMTVSLLNRPLIDFNLRALGGPDIMSLPAISSWLHAAILNVTDRFLVWPKEISVPLVPSLRKANAVKPIQNWTPPLGVLVLRVEEAEVQKRRSTFLGRWKLPNPRIAVVVPKEDEAGVAQMTLSSVKEKTLSPAWRHSKAFVVTQEKQPFRVLLSHRRVENFLGADMPLGSAEVDLDELFLKCNDAESKRAANFGEGAGKHSRSGSAKSSLKFETDTDEYETASSSPILGSPLKQVSWAMNPELNGQQDKAQDNFGKSILDILQDDSTFIESRILASEQLLKAQNGTSGMKHWTPPTKSIPWDAYRPTETDGDKETGIKELRECLEFDVRSGSVWIDIVSSPVMTMSGMVATALQPRKSLPLTPYESTGADNESGNWFASIQNFVMRSAFAEQEVNSDHESNDETSHVERDETMFHASSAGRVKVSFKWIPIASRKQETPCTKDDAIETSRSQGASAKTTPGNDNLINESADDMGQYQDASEDATNLLLPSQGSSSLQPLPSTPLIDRLLSQGDSTDSGVLGVRVAFTKIDYGDCPSNPVLSFGPVPASSVDGRSQHLLRTSIDKAGHRILSMDCQPGSRPGVLHWGQIFHLPVWRANDSRIRVELGNASSAFKLSSYGSELFLLDASGPSFEDDVQVEASAFIPLRDVMAKGMVEGNYRLREAKTERMAGVKDEQRLDIGRIVLSMSWFPF